MNSGFFWVNVAKYTIHGSYGISCFWICGMIYFDKKIPFLLFSKGPFDKLLSIEIKKTCLEVLRLLTWWFMGSFLTLILPPRRQAPVSMFHPFPTKFSPRICTPRCFIQPRENPCTVHPADASSKSLEVNTPKFMKIVCKRPATSRR